MEDALRNLALAFEADFSMPVFKKRGRPATGRTTTLITFRLPTDIVETLKRRAKQNDRSVSNYILPTMKLQFRPRKSRASYRDRPKVG